ncbi:hypothetical protein SU69_01565 [Thermosipho melanesiensis]|uniref:ATP synthase protein I n=2 Tax=Thermosipho melanesiensis TaxID=46541 RepID=A6LJR9_THEM4|nr:AtpZ/AtpI family protein [Thermosipho melanesiensis]ABR30170.1 hypothetical protein Tmel_0298 [Thermosipho melanesiensis BI429]APT73369.1 hypothetical protein BW47_01620 [Thermosipho melanesiensis]OOC38184.1 hypothetical protein SU68_01570 [Thermosipho melanesiensis]OOC40105.1 hypothetical protein SU70_01565 [Thermosipho melanesiensis]OOC40158.1 hypothetical protein SU69_01565 [Thermosipho melanesiensis]
MRKKDNFVREISKLNLVTVFGATILGNIIISYFIGKFLDELFNTEKLFVVIFLFFGAVSGLYNAIRQMLKEVEKVEKHEKRD